MHVVLFAGAMIVLGGDSWCSEQDWDKHSQRCLKKADLQDRFQQWSDMVRDISESANVKVPGIRVGSLSEEGDWRMEVWHLGEGLYEIRVRPESLRDTSDDTLMASSAHEVCHVIHGDAGYGTWDSWTEEKKKERQRVAWACAFAIIGREVIEVYLSEATTKYTPVEKKELLRIMKHDARWWLDWRQKTQKVVP